MSSPVIRVSAVVLRDQAGRILTVRKRGTDRFMLPGGKPEAGESPQDAAVRECLEEIGLDPSPLQLVGTHRAPAANEDGYVVEGVTYVGTLTGEPALREEIEELRWLDPTGVMPPDLAYHLQHRVLPALYSPVRAVTVFLGSSDGTDPHFLHAARAFGALLADCHLATVYGGGRVGLMGALADGALAAGGEVFGVIPQALMDLEVGHGGVSRLEVVPDMHVRKHRMAELGDAFVVLPGGIGTLEEFFEVWTWLQLRIHTAPVALLDVGGYWQPLVAMVDAMVTAGFLRREFADSLIVTDSPEELLARVHAWQPPAARKG